MTYVFTPGERVSLVPHIAPIWYNSHGEVTEWLPRSGMPGADGTKADRVRVKLDKWARPLIFLASDVNPL